MKNSLENYKWNTSNIKCNLNENNIMTGNIEGLSSEVFPEMVEILNKEIFNTKDLNKLSPDYNPHDPSILMNIRSMAVKPGSFRQPLQHVKRAKSPHINRGISLVNRELEKLKREFKNKEASNKILTKDIEHIHVKLIRKKKSKLEVDDDEIANEGPTDGPSDVEVNVETLFSESREVHQEIFNEQTTFLESEYSCTLKAIGKFESSNLIVSGVSLNCELLDSISTVAMISNKFDNFDTEGDLQSKITNDEISTETWDTNKAYKETKEKCKDTKEKCKETKEKLKETKDKLWEDLNFLEVRCLKTFNTLKNKEAELREQYLERKYFDHWRHWAKEMVKLKAEKTRQERIDNFFDELFKQKVSLEKKHKNVNDNQDEKLKKLARDHANYRHRYQVQKNIIALQKFKIEEQNRLIEELKFNKILESSKISLTELKDDIKSTYNEVDKRMKPRVKYLANELQVHEIEDPNLVLHCMKVPHFIQKMEQRAREREEKHAVIRERRKQMEEEKLRLKQQAELTKIEMDKEEKERRIQELKEKRRKEKIENIRKKKHEEKMRALIVMADIHYERNILQRCGLKPWIKLLKMKQDNLAIAQAHYIFQLKKNVFLKWLWHAEDMEMERNWKAKQFFRRKLYEKAFLALKLNHFEMVRKHQVAEDYYDLFVTQVVFRAWRRNTNISKLYYDSLWIIATKHHESNILFKALTLWRSLPALNAVQREQEARKARWRNKVLQVVPDYKPPDH